MTGAANHRDYYVYALLRRDNGKPFYIGYGRGKRWKAHEQVAMRPARNRDCNPHKTRIIRAMRRLGLDVPKVKIAENLTLAGALELERLLVAAIGRWPNGPLTNLTDGGDGGLNMAVESRAKISAARKGKPLSAAHRAAIGAGVRASADYREGMKTRKRHRPMSEEGRASLARNLVIARLAQSPERRAEIQAKATAAAAIANRGRHKEVPPEHLARMTELARIANLGRPWYTPPELIQNMTLRSVAARKARRKALWAPLLETIMELRGRGLSYAKIAALIEPRVSLNTIRNVLRDYCANPAC